MCRGLRHRTLLPNTHVGLRFYFLFRCRGSKKRLSRVVAGSECEPSVSGKSPHLLSLQDYRAVTAAVLIVFFTATSAENESGFGAFKFWFWLDFLFFLLYATSPQRQSALPHYQNTIWTPTWSSSSTSTSFIRWSRSLSQKSSVPTADSRESKAE